jgi:hypothetical protein
VVCDRNWPEPAPDRISLFSISPTPWTRCAPRRFLVFLRQLQFSANVFLATLPGEFDLTLAFAQTCFLFFRSVVKAAWAADALDEKFGLAVLFADGMTT